MTPRQPFHTFILALVAVYLTLAACANVAGDGLIPYEGDDDDVTPSDGDPWDESHTDHCNPDDPAYLLCDEIADLWDDVPDHEHLLGSHEHPHTHPDMYASLGHAHDDTRLTNVELAVTGLDVGLVNAEAALTGLDARLVIAEAWIAAANYADAAHGHADLAASEHVHEQYDEVGHDHPALVHGHPYADAVHAHATPLLVHQPVALDTAVPPCWVSDNGTVGSVAYHPLAVAAQDDGALYAQPPGGSGGASGSWQGQRRLYDGLGAEAYPIDACPAIVIELTTTGPAWLPLAVSLPDGTVLVSSAWPLWRREVTP